MSAGSSIGRRGAPLAVLAVLLTAWVGVRAVTWDDPFASTAMARGPVDVGAARVDEAAVANGGSRVAENAPQSLAYPRAQLFPQHAPQIAFGAHPYPAYLPPGAYAVGSAPVAFATPPSGRVVYASARSIVPVPQGDSSFPLAPDLAAGHQRLMREAFGVDWHTKGVRYRDPRAHEREGVRSLVDQEARPPFAAQSLPKNRPSADRWMLDVYGFFRQGSGALSVTQGRLPIYGASQLAANLQWRARPSSSHDPRVYARAYHALVTGGESEIAAGASALPIGDVPVRLYGELRATRSPGASEEGLASRIALRPTAFAATEIPPQKLPHGFSLEAYGAGGYVVGKDSTYFVDGQMVAARALARIGKAGSTSGAVSLGAGIWGGAQEGAQRVDIGPTLRFDVNIGEVPARVSVDYREQVAGDAEPDSGVAATVSTRF